MRIFVDIPVELGHRLVEVAEQEHREPRRQIVWFLEQALMQSRPAQRVRQAEPEVSHVER